MNALLERMLETGIADDASATPLHSHMDAEEGALIDRAFREVKPVTSVEIGMAYGVSTLFACEALATTGANAVHIVLDPFQTEIWHRIGLKNIERAGYARLVDFREERSEIALPALLAAGTRIQAAIIDGNHTFDHVLVDFFFINKMLDVGGIVIFDDTDFPAIARLMSHIMTYPAYRLFGAVPDIKKVRWRGRVRRAMARSLPALRRSWDQPHCMAFRKVAEDLRNWDWHADF